MRWRWGVALTYFVSGMALLTAGGRDAPATVELKIHPRVFNLVACWISDSESPVVTEINLDAVEKNGNQFNDDGLKMENGWLRCPTAEGGFMRYRVAEAKGNRYKVEYQ